MPATLQPDPLPNGTVPLISGASSIAADGIFRDAGSLQDFAYGPGSEFESVIEVSHSCKGSCVDSDLSTGMAGASAIARDAITSEADSLRDLADGLGTEFERAIDVLLACKGRVVVSGMGKSGLVGRKLAATLSSTGTPSFFLHPAEAMHGDLGAIRASDVLLLISNSGETEEILRLLPSIRSFGNTIIAITSEQSSTLSGNADVALVLPFRSEICPNNLAPTTSTLLTMALGDGIAVALMKKRDFKPVDFARFHPGGSLGRMLLTKVQDEMHKLVPTVPPHTRLDDVIISMTQGRLGLVVVTEQGALRGIFTDGDLRRALLAGRNALELPVSKFMTGNPVTIERGASLGLAQALMQEHSISSLVVVDDAGAVCGVLDLLSSR